MLLGNYVSDRFQAMGAKIRIVGVTIPTIILCVIVISGHYRDTIWYAIYDYLPNTRDASAGWKAIFEEIENSEDKDVIITIPAYYLGTILMTPQFGEGEENYVNYTAAEYFGKDSLTVNIDWDDLRID